MKVFIQKRNNSTESLTQRFKLFLKRVVTEGDFFKNRIVLWLLVLNFFANVANWIIIAVFINKVDGNIILHYNAYFGVDAMGDWRGAFLLPLIGLILFVLNAILANFFYKNKERIASYVLLLASFMAEACLIIASTSIIIINY